MNTECPVDGKIANNLVSKERGQKTHTLASNQYATDRQAETKPINQFAVIFYPISKKQLLINIGTDLPSDLYFQY